MSDHLLDCRCSVDLGPFDTLVSDGKKLRLCLKENLSIKQDQPTKITHQIMSGK